MPIDSNVLAWALIGVSFFVSAFSIKVNLPLGLIFAGFILLMVGLIIIYPTLPVIPTQPESDAWFVTMFIFVAFGIIEMMYGALSMFEGDRL